MTHDALSLLATVEQAVAHAHRAAEIAFRAPLTTSSADDAIGTAFSLLDQARELLRVAIAREPVNQETV